jgi:hypothetical protein
LAASENFQSAPAGESTDSLANATAVRLHCALGRVLINPVCTLMSASLQKRSNCCDAAKCRMDETRSPDGQAPLGTFGRKADAIASPESERSSLSGCRREAAMGTRPTLATFALEPRPLALIIAFAEIRNMSAVVPVFESQILRRADPVSSDTSSVILIGAINCQWVMRHMDLVTMG